MKIATAARPIRISVQYCLTPLPASAAPKANSSPQELRSPRVDFSHQNHVFPCRCAMSIHPGAVNQGPPTDNATLALPAVFVPFPLGHTRALALARVCPRWHMTPLPPGNVCPPAPTPLRLGRQARRLPLKLWWPLYALLATLCCIHWCSSMCLILPIPTIPTAALASVLVSMARPKCIPKSPNMDCATNP